jgi:3',5'-cyclic AMP phosphodiesterase CpdA
MFMTGRNNHNIDRDAAATLPYIRHLPLRDVVSLLLCLFIALLPAVGAAQDRPWRFVVFSDTRSNPCDAGGANGVNTAVVSRIATAVATEKPDLVLVPGDLVLGTAYRCGPAVPFETQLENWRKVMKPVYDARIPVLPVRGNHEFLSNEHFPNEPCRSLVPNPVALKTWLRVFGPLVPENAPRGGKETTFAYPHKNALFIGMDELTHYLSFDPLWLDKAITANRRQHLFIYGHFPAFGVVHRDNLSCNSTTRDLLWNTMGANNARFYFCGHDHLYDRGEVTDAAGNRLQQVLVGNGGAPFYTYTGAYADTRMRPIKRILGTPGYLVVTVDGATVSAELKTLDNGVFTVSDRFGYTLSP